MMPKFKIGDRVVVKNMTSIFHTRTQEFVRDQPGIVVDTRPDWVVPEDEAFDRLETGRTEPFYVVSFKQTDLWPRYTGFDIDTLETECAEGWLRALQKDD
ncbi:nitrile hydratase subunit beta [Rhodococcus sp. MS16]|nr:SH3-like domain-containing protein [Rhodococcus sp. MS16]NRI69850.1 nitrile hydratase subunit beta [Rhodococcus sp. MS16]